MKKYVILTGIVGIGGSIIYTRNKKIFLEREGWNVEVFSSEKGNVVFEELKCFEKNYVSELRFPPDLCNEKQRKNIIYMITDKILSGQMFDEIIIESHFIPGALWGEAIAELIHAKHLIYLLNEIFPFLSKEMFDFMDFKHKRRELAGISEKSLELLFKNHKIPDPHERYFLKAICTNVVEDVENSIIDSIRRSDIVIGSIGRLEKGYVWSLAKNVAVFAQRNQDKIITLILVGGSRFKATDKKLRRIISTGHNIELVVTGFMYPIPRKLFSLVDIFVSGAGSARVSAAEGVLTMTVDVNTGKPIGLLGYDTNNSIYGDKEQTKSIAQMLQDVLIEKEMHKKKIPMKYEQTIPDFRQRYAEHMDFIERSEQEKEYYPVDKIKLVDKRGSIKKLLFKTLGRTGYEKVVSMYARLKAKKRY